MTPPTEASHRVVEIARDAVKAGRVTKEEADAYLKAKYNVTLDSYPVSVTRTHLAVLAVLFVALLGTAAFFITPHNLAGSFVLSNVAGNVTNTSYPVNMPVVGLNVTGLLYGDGTATVYFDTPAGTLLVGTVASDNGLPRTTKASYSAGEEITLEHAPAAASYYFDDGTASSPVDIPFTATTNGTLLIVANESGNLTTYRLPIIIGTEERVTAFTDLCDQTCAMNETNGTLRVETTGTAIVQLTSANAATTQPSNPPVQTTPFNSITLSGATTIDLNAYFASPDGLPLSYGATGDDIVAASVTGSILTLTPKQDGTTTVTVYASDLHDLVTASIAVTVVLPNAPTDTVSNASNVSAANNSAPPILPPNIPANDTNLTALDCSNPNPNLRPIQCLQQNPQEYFQEQDSYWENSARERVAKFNVLGNMLIKGGVVENSVQQPSGNDFKLGYEDRDGLLVPTIWIDSQGNLNLRGRLYEEQVQMMPPPGSYTLITKRSVFLAYADTTNGNLFVRGNIIPYRRAIE